MSIRVVEAIYASARDLDSTAVTVLARLGCFASDDGGGVFPSLARVAAECRLSQRAVQYAIRRMESMGVLVKVADEHPGAKRGREYRIALDALAGTGDGCTTCRGARDAGVHDVRPRGAPRAGVGVHHVHPESSLEPLGNRQKTLLLDDEPQECPDDIEAEFATWWLQVPKKAAKATAQRAYRFARKKATAEQLLAGIIRYAAEVQVKGTEPRYIAHPATWLNGERWLDEQAPAGATVTPIRPASRPASSTMEAFADLYADTPEAARERERFRL